ncbi:RNA-binding motif protein, Y chromosome, family 1 member B-like [Rattus rattus]|uniref:RNA-binding motif protein, Y chromosome, family 1 member B-like n=1 Tax=Rattus rattus TaxID=10117 RepID=UPI0013F31039|nr:RNA-binding motif protein, Y chromosome, family 1 member B-like [Rattus rattus]
MAESEQPGKIFIGGLNLETRQKTLQVIFGRFGPITHVILMRDRETKKSRGFAFVTFQCPGDAKNAVKEMNGVSLDGKRIKVEQARRPSSLERGSKRRPLSFSRTRGASRILKCGRGGSSRGRSRPSRERNLDDGRYTPNFNISSSGRHFAVKRSTSSKREGPPSKRSATAALTRANPGLRGQEPHGREVSRNMPRREPVSSRRDEYPLPRDDGYSSNDSFSRRYASTSRGYRDYGNYSSRDEHASKVFSDHAGYHGGRDRDFSEYLSGNSYRDTYESYGSFHEEPSARGTYTGNNRYDDYSSSRGGYGGGRETYSGSRSDIYGYERSGRQVLPPIDREYSEHGGREERGHSPMDRLYRASHESYTISSRFGGYHGGHEETRYESGGRR